MSLSRSLAIFRHELRILMKDWVSFVLFLAMPLLLMVFLKNSFRFAVQSSGVSDVNGAEQAVPGLTTMFAFFGIGNAGFTFFREHGWNTWDRLRASWARPSEIMVGKLLTPLVYSFCLFVLLFAVGGALLGLRVRGSYAGLALLCLATCMSVVSLGLVIAAVCRTIMQVNMTTNIGAFALAGIGGAIAPTAALPGWARSIAPVSPGYWSMRGFRSVILFGGGIDSVLLPVGVLLAITAGLGMVAASRFRFEETKLSWA